MLTRNQQLNTQQLTDLDTLCANCKNTDGNSVAIYKHLLKQYRPVACNILNYQQQQLIGFLSTFFFYEDTCEIIVMVAPTFRRKGVATQMIKEILPLLRGQRIKMAMLSTPKGLNNKWLSSKGFDYQNSEYQMQWKLHEPIIIANKSLVIRPATDADIPILCAIDDACFPIQQPHIESHFQELLHDASYKLFIAEKKGEPIGKTHLSCQQGKVRLTDIAILPKAQGNGFGSEMVAHCINYCLAANLPDINLDVETSNQGALRLYNRLGFIVSNAYDFWKGPIEALQIK